MFTKIEIKHAGFVECEIMGITGKGSLRVRRTDNGEEYIINRQTFSFYKKHEEMTLIPETITTGCGKEIKVLN